MFLLGSSASVAAKAFTMAFIAQGFFLEIGDGHSFVNNQCQTGYAPSAFSGQDSITNVVRIEEGMRSRVECSLVCLQELLCTYSYYSEETRKCTITGIGPSSDILEDVKDFTGWKTSPALPTHAGQDACADLNCIENSICLYSCVEGETPKPYCAANTKSCGTSPQISNLVHYYVPEYQDDTDNGFVQRVPYTKKSALTDLRVTWYANLRAHYGGTNQCGRWRILFNGSDCASPNRIDFVDFEERNLNDLRQGEVDGICYGLSAGFYEIGVYVDPCPGYETNDIYTGWNSNRQMMVYETDGRQGVDRACPGLSIFNTNQYVENESDSNDGPDHVTMTVSITKTDPDSSIFIQYNANSAVYYANASLSYCGRWYITFNGNECSDPQMIDMVIHPAGGGFDHRRNAKRGYSMQGICKISGTGTISVQSRIGNCYYPQSGAPADTHHGWNSISRLIAQEIRLGEKTNTVITSDGILERLAMFNIQHNAWHLLDDPRESGAVVTATYVKSSADSGLRLTWSGDNRHLSSGESCGRWFFTIDGAECTNPGPVEGVSYYNYSINYHRSAVISGICYGISEGSHTIAFEVGNCEGYSGYDMATGWGSTSRIIMMETYVSEYWRCTNAAQSSCTEP